MDRSYPYSRRLVSRARLRKRVAAVAAAGLVGATALFMLTWKPDPIAAALPAPALLLLAMNDGLHAGAPDGRGVRRIYPYSVVPGGVAGPAELKRVIRTDSVVAAHYATFDADKARAVVVDKPRAVHVSYRKGDKVYWTAHKVMLAPGETLLSDGSNEMRARCANRISEVAQFPVEAHQPAMEELDRSVEVGDGEQYALGPDGMPVSMAGDGLGRQPGVRVPGLGGSGGGSARSGTADTAASSTLASRSSSSASGTGPISTMGLSGSSSSMGGFPRPSSRPGNSAPVTSPTSPADPAAGSGTDGGSSAAPAPLPQPGAATEDPVTLPLPDTTTPLPPGGNTVPGTPAGPGPTVTEPAPLPGTTPTPGTTEQPPLVPSVPSLPSVPSTPSDPAKEEQTGGGGSSETPHTPPTGSGPQPEPTTDPSTPKPGPDPLPPQTGAGQPPTERPDPASIWLFGLAAAAMAALRRRASA